MSRSTVTLAGLLAAGALAVPMAQAAPPPTASGLGLDKIPDPDSVPKGPPKDPGPVETPDPGEPPDAGDGDEEPVTTPVPVVTAAPTVVMEAPTEVSTQVPTEAAAATPEIVSAPDSGVLVGEPEGEQQTPEATPTPTVSPAPVQTGAVPVTSKEPNPGGTAAPLVTNVHNDHPRTESGPAVEPQRGASRPERRSAARRPVTKRVPTGADLPVQLPVGGDQFRLPVVVGANRPHERVVAVRTRAGKTRLGRRTHLIRAGETLSGIAARYGLSWQRLAGLNNVEDPDLIYAGNTLMLY